MARKGWKKPKNVVLYTKNITDKGDNMLERVNDTKDLKKLTEEEKKNLEKRYKKIHHRGSIWKWRTFSFKSWSSWTYTSIRKCIWCKQR